MTRLTLPLVLCALACALVCIPTRADDLPKKLTPEERKELEAKRTELNAAGLKAHQAGKYADAVKSFEESLKLARELFNKGEYPDGHPDLAQSLHNLAFVYREQAKYAAAETLHKDALEIRKRLFKGQDHPDLVASLSNLAVLYESQGKYADAEPLYKDALEMRKRLSQGQDHPFLALSLNNLATVYESQGKYAAAETLYKDALDMNRRLFKGQDHSFLARSLNNLAGLSASQGKYADAESLYKDALDMNRRLFKGQDHPALAASLNNLASLYESQAKYAAAETLYKDALEMRKRLFKGQDHPDLAASLNNLASLYREQEKYAAAETLYTDALEMHKRLFKGQDHPALATSLNNLAFLYFSQGKYANAEPLYKDALEMRKRLFKGQDHRALARSLNNLAQLYAWCGKYADAELLYKDALGMCRRLTVALAQDKTEGETLTLLASQPLTRDGFLSNARGHTAEPAGVYAQLWADKGYVARAYERRQLQARAAAADPKAAKVLAELTDARRRRAELLLAPVLTDPATRDKREKDIKTYGERIEQKTGELKKLLPVLERSDKLSKADAAELQKALPADAAVVDFLRFVHFEQDKDNLGNAERQTLRYLAFVVTKDKVAWVELDTAAKIEPTINAWRDAITGGKEIPAAMPAKVRELIWEPVRKQLPANIKTVYICPDEALCKVPFAAIPGDRAGTILLEDYALATIPHAPFLLDKLWPQDERKNPPSGALVVGGVKYDAEVAGGTVGSAAGPLVKPDAKLAWAALPGTVGELNGVAATAERKKIAPTRIEGEKATPAAVLAALPKAKYAHFATHGFFADASFRSIFQLDPKDYEMRGGERIGRAVNSPLVMTGLVFAGANNPKTPGRGIVTGEQLIDLDLSGLELAVLSACETGVGDVAGGQGTFGLQRAFHYAGTTNVVASLWKVPDASTAALMSLFYTNLWDKNLSPMEALRQAQLELYKNPQKIPELAKGFRGKFDEVSGAAEVKPTADGKAHPLLWAAFTLSGPGR